MPPPVRPVHKGSGAGARSADEMQLWRGGEPQAASWRTDEVCRACMVRQALAPRAPEGLIIVALREEEVWLARRRPRDLHGGSWVGRRR